MENLKVSLVQANQLWEDKTGNYSNYERLLQGIEQTDLIVLPEMFNTAFTMNAENLAESMEDSSAINWLKLQAKKHNAAIYTSFIVSENGSFFNRGIFVEPSGMIHSYDKRKTFGLAGEDKIFSKGDVAKVVAFRGWNIRLQICYDLRFPEIALNHHVDGHPEYDLLLYVANWPERRSSHWRNLLPARAIENQCYLVAVNRVGEDKTGLKYSGDSCALDLHGNRLVDMIQLEEVKTIELDAKELKEMRERLPFLKDRHL